MRMIEKGKLWIREEGKVKKRKIDLKVIEKRKLRRIEEEKEIDYEYD